MKLDKYKEKGYTGLSNLGNTCFLNSCIQVLNHTYEFHNVLDSAKIKNLVKEKSVDSTILIEWNDLRNVMWSGNGTVSPNRFVMNIQHVARVKNKDLFTGWAQNDMPEFLLFMMDCIHSSISRGITMKISGKVENNVDTIAVNCYNMLKETYSKEYSEIMAMFYGVYISEIVSLDGKTQHMVKPESYFILDLPVLNGMVMMNTLYECLDLFTTPEVLEGENAWFNEKTSTKENVQKRISFWNFPQVLVIMLKRITPDGQRKVHSLIQFPLDHLDLSKYVRGYNASSHVYELYGVCNHMGGVLGGHYTAYVKNAENVWIHYNDTIVEKVSNPETTVVTPKAYCLFYRKKNSLL